MDQLGILFWKFGACFTSIIEDIYPEFSGILIGSNLDLPSITFISTHSTGV